MSIDEAPPVVDTHVTEREPPGGGRRSGLIRGLVGVGAVLVVALAGANSVADTTLVSVAILLVAVLPLINIRPTTWIALAVAVTWTSRLLTALGSAPRFLDFMDFPLVLIAFLFAGLRHLDDGRLLPPAHRAIGRRVLLVTVAIVLSWAFSNLGEPQRLIAGWVLAMEPFLLLMAVLLAPMTERERILLLRLAIILLCGQVLFSAVEIAGGAVADEVKGMLFGAGAGHHVSAGGLTLGFFLLFRSSAPRLLKLAYSGAALLVIVIADAKQVLFVLPLALLVFGVTSRRRRSAGSLIGSMIAGVLMAAGSVVALLSYSASSIAFDFLDRSATNKTGKVAVVNALWNDISASIPTLAFGFGPGETVSRFSYLTTPALLKEGSPVYLLGLQPSDRADYYNTIAFSGPFTGGSSFTSAQSSALGILGDYGLFGLVAFAALIVAIIRALQRLEDRRMRSAALASWAMLLPLAVVFDWLEQPPFTLAVMLITGIALRTPTLSAIGPLTQGRRVASHSANTRALAGDAKR